MSNEDARIESVPSSLATYSGPKFSEDFSKSFSTSTEEMGGRLCSSAGTPTNSSSTNLTNQEVTCHLQLANFAQFDTFGCCQFIKLQDFCP